MMKHLKCLLLSAGFLGLSLTGLHAGVVFNSLASFNYTNGSHPTAELLLGLDGNYYGTSHNGGTTNGTVFRMTPAGAVTNLMSFGMSNGANPHAALIQGSNGLLYGTTEEGGTNGGTNGTVFQITTNGQLTSLFSFNNTNGSDPMGALVQGPDGTLYGTTSSGGTNGGYGTVFQLTTGGQLTTLISFNNTNGATPLGALLRTADGTLFGTTSAGGSNGFGTVFQITTNRQFSTLATFNGTNGASPYSGLILAGDGNFYGTTFNGGSNGVGNVFKMTRTGSVSNLASFNNLNGANPRGVLLQGPDGNFYGTTESGGTNGFGTIFQATPGGTINSLLSFDPVAGGDLPVAGLILGADGLLYGTTQSGGAKAVGTVYSLNVPMAPVFRSVTQSGGTVHLTWSAVAGRAYQLQWISNLTQTNWTNLGSASNALSGIMSGSDVVGPTPRFYQLQLISP